MTTVIRCWGWNNELLCPHEGQYVESGDHEAEGGRGYFTFTKKLKRAKRFSSVKEALEFYRKQSVIKPLRRDGLPNRPLTAMHAEFINL